MLDIKQIRENPEQVNKLLRRRSPELNIDEILKIDEKRRSIQKKADDLRKERKEISSLIGQMKQEGKDTSEIQARTRKFGDTIKKLEQEEAILIEQQNTMLLNIPNLPQ